MSSGNIYENGDAEAMVLLKIRPFITAVFLIFVGYVAAGMPLPAGTSAEFAMPFRQLARVMVIPAVFLTAVLWSGLLGRPTASRVRGTWLLGQVVIGAGVFGLIVFVIGRLS